MRRFWPTKLLAYGALMLAPIACAAASVSVIDDAKRTVTLPSPARRIVSLAPHATEMLFAAGAGPYIVGVAEFSDFPPEAKRIPSVGSGVSLDLERIIQLKPDRSVSRYTKANLTTLRRLPGRSNA